MKRVEVGGASSLGYREWGDGPIPVLFVHGNLASKDWIELSARWFPKDLRVIGIDWRGCGDSDRPARSTRTTPTTRCSSTPTT